MRSGSEDLGAGQPLSSAEALRRIVEAFPDAATREPLRVKGLLKDLAPSSRKGVHLLILAMEAGVPALLSSSAATPGRFRVEQARTLLMRNYATEEVAASWAVATWAVALGIEEALAASSIGMTGRDEPDENPGEARSDRTAARSTPVDPEPIGSADAPPWHDPARGGRTGTHASSPNDRWDTAVDAPHPARERHRRPRRRTVAAVGIGLCVIGALATAEARRSQDDFSLRLDGDVVTVTNGIRALGLGSQQQVSVRSDLLPVDTRRRLRAGAKVRGRATADAFLRDLDAQARRCASSITAPCEARPAIVPALTVSVESYPRGNVVRLSWAAPDARPGVRTVLSLNGGGPPPGCPPSLTAEGSCELTGSWDTPYQVAIVATAPGRDPFPGMPVTVRTYARPQLTVRAGDVFGFRGEKFCRVLVSARGLLPRHVYDVQVLMADDTVPETHTLQRATDARGDLHDGRLDIGADDPTASLGYYSPSGGWLTATVTDAGRLTATAQAWNCPRPAKSSATSSATSSSP